MSNAMSWLNEPPQWSDRDGLITVRTGLKTDFWRNTFYGYVTDNGHFYHRPVTGDFTAEVVVAAGHSTLFDQAGLMLRADERTWLKTGLEVTSGAVQLSTVLTRGDSDLSVVPVPDHDGELRLRLTRFGSAVCVHRGAGDGSWQLVRLGQLDLPEVVEVGVMCCSPERSGLEVTFRDFRVRAPIPREGLE
jgi:regulation of enolase protein 1 (concanavalin A-like superfamily)